MWGSRAEKYQALWQSRLGDDSWQQLEMRGPQFAFVKRDYQLQEKYQTGFAVQELMPVNSVGIVTARDALTIDMDKETLWTRVEDFATESDPEVLRHKYALGKDVQDWSVLSAQMDVKANFNPESLTMIAYRSFDNRWTFYTGKSRGFQCRPRDRVMRHYQKDNFGLVTARSNKNSQKDHFFITTNITEAKLGESSTQSATFPLYLYPEATELDQTRRVNMDPKIRARIEKAAMGFGVAAASRPPLAAPQHEVGDTRSAKDGALAATIQSNSPHPEARPKGASKGVDGQDIPDASRPPKAAINQRPDELQIFDYIYGVLHCPAYRETYGEFLKIDFPRVPYPASPQIFWDLAEKGSRLRRLHLMQEDAIGDTAYLFTGDGDSVVEKPVFAPAEDGIGHVYINKTQCFENVPDITWNFYIGGYQPAQKWLKDRKGRALSFNDIRHYQKIIKILSETHRIMQSIELPLS